IWDREASQFEFSAAVHVSGGLSASGSLSVQDGITTRSDITINADNGASDAILTFGNDLGAETFRFSDAANAFVLSDDLIVQGNISGSSLTISSLVNCARLSTTVAGDVACGSGLGIAQTVIVAKSGGDFTSVKDAIDSIVDASASKQYVVLVYPGIYQE